MGHGVLKRPATDILVSPGVTKSLQRPQPSGHVPAARGGGISAATSVSGENPRAKNAAPEHLAFHSQGLNLWSVNCVFSASPSQKEVRARRSLVSPPVKPGAKEAERASPNSCGWRPLSWLPGQCPFPVTTLLALRFLCRGAAGPGHLNSPAPKGTPEEKDL